MEAERNAGILFTSNYNDQVNRYRRCSKNKNHSKIKTLFNTIDWWILIVFNYSFDFNHYFTVQFICSAYCLLRSLALHTGCSSTIASNFRGNKSAWCVCPDHFFYSCLVIQVHSALQKHHHHQRRPLPCLALLLVPIICWHQHLRHQPGLNHPHR